jgi:single-stranded-DNA-specific exonuclease
MNDCAWQLKERNTAGEKNLAGDCGALLARVLAARGLDTPEKAGQLLAGETSFADPNSLKDMEKAAARIRAAVNQEETIVIFGDYDVDGVSATAILYEYLTNLGGKVRCKLPSREGGGYGIDCETLKKLKEKGFTLVVTVDNGISAVEEAACARQLGIDLVITDHHLPPETLPDAVAVVDPNRTDDTSGCGSLCGAGVALFLCAALEECSPAELLEECGDFAALGTIADVVPLTGMNRAIVRRGLALIQDTVRPGLAALLEAAGYAGKPVTAQTVSYGLAPRLNAAGRMDSAAIALKLLLCEDEEQATGIAARLTEINTARQSAEQEILAAALQKLAEEPQHRFDRVIVAAGENWHPGVIGIVASRLMERFGRPAIVISIQNGEGRGSGRAPRGFNLHGALADCAELLLRYGGHPAAAGLLIDAKKIEQFRRVVNDWAAKTYPVPKPQTLLVDAEAAIGELTLESVRELSRMEPFGSGNPVPLFLLRSVMVDGMWPLGTEGRHTRLKLRQGANTCFTSLFGTPPSRVPYPTGTMVDAVVEASLFEGRNGPMLSLHLRGLRPAGIGNEPCEQSAQFTAVCGAEAVTAQESELFLPTRQQTAVLYRLIRAGGVSADDLMPTFAALGAENTGKTLAGLAALTELGLIEERDGRYLPTVVTEKKNLAAAPILQKLASGG